METVGVPREIKPGERRAALTPGGVSALHLAGIPVVVESRAGQASGFSDSEYRAAGATVVPNRSAVWSRASFIVKVKEPQPKEFPLFRKRHILFCFLHLASPENLDLLGELRRARLTAIAYEGIVVKGEAVILNPMSEMAGTLAGYFAAIFKTAVRVKKNTIVYRLDYKRGLGKAIERFPKPLARFSPGNVFVFGGGHVGLRAAEMCARSGGKVFVSEINPERRRILRRHFAKEGLRVRIVPAKGNFEKRLEASDCLIGAVYQKGRRAPVLVDRKMLEKISAEKKKLILDVAVDQGGNFYGSRSTHYDEPLYLDEFGNLRFGMSNLPSLFGRKASLALENATLPYILALGAGGLEGAIQRYPETKQAVEIQQGRLSESLGRSFSFVARLGGNR